MGNKIGRKSSKPNVELLKVNKKDSTKRKGNKKLRKEERKEMTHQNAETNVNNETKEETIQSDIKGEEEIEKEDEESSERKESFILTEESEKYASLFSEDVIKEAFKKLKELIVNKMFTPKVPVTGDEMEPEQTSKENEFADIEDNTEAEKFKIREEPQILEKKAKLEEKKVDNKNEATENEIFENTNGENELEVANAKFQDDIIPDNDEDSNKYLDLELENENGDENAENETETESTGKWLALEEFYEKLSQTIYMDVLNYFNI